MAKLSGKVIAAVKRSSLTETQILSALGGRAAAAPMQAESPAEASPDTAGGDDKPKTRRGNYQRRDLTAESN